MEKIHAEVKESDDIVVNVHDKTDNDAKQHMKMMDMLIKIPRIQLRKD